VTDLSNLRQVLAQTHSVERLQESARRRGEVDQQKAGRVLMDRVDVRGRQVEEKPPPEEPRVNEEGSGNREAGGGSADRGGRRAPGEGKGTDRGDRPDDPEEGKGRLVDVKA